MSDESKTVVRGMTPEEIAERFGDIGPDGLIVLDGWSEWNDPDSEARRLIRELTEAPESG